MELSYIARRNIKWLSFGGTVLQFIKNLNIESPFDPAILLLVIYPKELRRGTQTDTCKAMFIAVLFTIATGGKSKCP